MFEFIFFVFLSWICGYECCSYFGLMLRSFCECLLSDYFVVFLEGMIEYEVDKSMSISTISL